MKTLALIAIALFISASTLAQTDLLKDKILIGKIKDNKFTLLVDTVSFLEAFKIQFPEKDYDTVELKSDYTIGNKQKLFYYITISSSKDGGKVVRWLSNKNGKLYLENNLTGELDHKDYFVACEGVDKCQPRLYDTTEELNWICGETLGCVTEEEAKRNPCIQETSIITAAEF